MKAIPILIAIFTLSVTYSCVTKLEVTVAIANKSTVKNLPSVREELNSQYVRIVNNLNSNGFLETLKGSSKLAIANIIENDSSIDVESGKDIIKNLSVFSDSIIANFNVALNSIVDTNVDKTALNYHMWVSSILQFKILLSNELETETILPETEILRTIDKNIDLSEASRINRISQGFGTFGDPLASYIIHAPETIWSLDPKATNDKFNRAFARANFGKADMAVIMEDIGQFQLKGARVDAKETIQAISKSANMTLNLVAKSMALPISLPSTNADSSTKYSSSGQNAIYDAELAKRDFAKSQREFELYSLSAIDAIILNSKQINNVIDSTALINSLKSIVTQYQTSLNTIIKN